jgi:hypothetical protein
VGQVSGEYGIGVRANEDFTAWCQQHFARLNEGGTWIVPRSNLVFTKRGDKLYLTERGPYTGYNQQEDLDLHRHHFGQAGIEIVDET